MLCVRLEVCWHGRRPQQAVEGLFGVWPRQTWPTARAQEAAVVHCLQVAERMTERVGERVRHELLLLHDTAAVWPVVAWMHALRA